MTKASNNVFPKLIGSEGTAPATPAATTSILYVKADGLWYSKDDAGAETLVSGGSGMSNPMTTAGDIIKGGAAGAAERLAIGTAGQVLTVNAGATAPEWAAAAGGGVSWTQVVDQSGASFTGWTAVDGTWASDGTIIQETGTPEAAYRRAYYATAIPFGFGAIAEAEIRLPTTGQGTGTNVQAGIIIGQPAASTTGALGVTLEYGGTDATLLQASAVSTIKAWNAAKALDTWYKVRLVATGGHATVYLDGVELGSALFVALGNIAGDYFALINYNSLADFRNIKVWVMSGGAPA